MCRNERRARRNGDRHCNYGDASMEFEIVSPIDNVEVIASGRGVVQARRLNRMYGKGRWRKLKGFASVKYRRSGEARREEVHWYEAHGIGKREFKVKLRPS